jgi:hypothetical protein
MSTEQDSDADRPARRPPRWAYALAEVLPDVVCWLLLLLAIWLLMTR